MTVPIDPPDPPRKDDERLKVRCLKRMADTNFAWNGPGGLCHPDPYRPSLPQSGNGRSARHLRCSRHHTRAASQRAAIVRRAQLLRNTSGHPLRS